MYLRMLIPNIVKKLDYSFLTLRIGSLTREDNLRLVDLKFCIFIINSVLIKLYFYPNSIIWRTVCSPSYTAMHYSAQLTPIFK